GDRSPEGAEEDVRKRPVHRAAHEDREQRSRGADERAADDERVVREDEAGGRGGEPRERVQERDDDRHVGAADRKDEQDTEEERRRKQDDEPDITLRRGGEAGERDARGEEPGIEDVLTREGDRPAGEDLLELPERDQ